MLFKCGCWLFMVAFDINEDEEASVVTTGIPWGERSGSVGVGGPADTTMGDW